MPQRRIILYHILAWLIFFSLPILSIWPSSAALIRLPRPPAIFWMSSLFQLMLFYGTAYWLMPYFYLRKKYWWFVLGVLGLLLLRSLVLSALPLPELPGGPMPALPRPMEFGFRRIFHVFPGFVTIVLSMGFRLTIEHRKVERDQKDRETETLRSELRFLRSQISPHFLFNVLNSLTALARKKSDLLEPSLIKLSELMRYTLYETEQDLIPLESEIDYIESYIQLQQLRFEAHLQLQIQIDRSGMSQHQIAPMLLIPLIENAFKYGSQVVTSPSIALQLYLQQDQRLVLYIRNTCTTTNQPFDSDAATGLGLANLRRRLALLYPERAMLSTQKSDTEFDARLEIDL